MASARNLTTLSVRIEPDTFDKLKEFTEQHSQYSQAFVVGRLLDYFNRQDSEVRQVILTGLEIDYLELVGRFFQLLDLGDHAYDRKFWVWAIESFLQADRQASGGEKALQKIPEEAAGSKARGVVSLRRLVWFKISSAFMDLGMELRHRALVDHDTRDDEWKAYYLAAIDSLRVAIAYHRLFNASLKEAGAKPHPAILYNEACAWTLMAQYTREMSLGPEDAQVQDVQKEARRSEAERLASMQGPGTCVVASNDPKAAAALDNALQCLTQIRNRYKGTAEGMPLGETHWMIEFADKDSDLECLRRSREKEFGDWFREHHMRTRLIEAFRTVRNNLPRDVEAMLETVQD
jgi:hypothetical protein